LNEIKWFFKTMPFKIKSSYIISFLFILISSLISIAIPLFYKFIIDSFQENEIDNILKGIIFYIIINAISTFFFWLGEYLFRAKSSNSVNYYMNKAYIWGIQNKRKINPEIIINDPLAFGDFSSLIYSLIEIIKIPIPLLLIFILDKNAFFISLISVVVWFIYIKYDRKYVDKNQDIIIENERENFDFIDDSIKGFREISMTGTFLFEFKKVQKRYMHWYKKVKSYIKKRNLYLIVLEIIKILVMISFIVYSFYGFYRNQYLLGTVFALISYYEMLEIPIENSFDFSQYFGYYKKLINNLKDIKEEKVEKRYDIGEIKEIKIKDLDFSYGEKEIFNKVNITIKKGEKVAIIGKSGEGKTTFIKLITGNETPEKGETLINDKPTNEIKNIYEKIGVLSQNSHIFNRSIKENITMGREISEEKLNNILHITGVEKFINEKTVGQNGKNLSGGQRVRVALARMMISDPEVVILDEPLEGVDKIREEEVIKNIKKYTKDKTVIIISHRFSILNMAKRIIGIENGKVVLDGEKEEALKNKTILKDFFDAENRMTVMKKGEDVIE